jgi:folate-binding protein YgfZ
MAIALSDYEKVTNVAGVFDATATYGRLFARGKDAIDLLHRMSSGDVQLLEKENGKAALTALTNEKGRIVDVVMVIRDETSDIMLVTSRDKEQTVIQWLDKFTIMEDARFERATEAIAQFLICGPTATSILASYTNANLSSATRADVFGICANDIPATITKAPSLAGSGWFIFTGSEFKDALWSKLDSDIKKVGGGIIDDDLFELLRIENGTPIAPNELNEKHNPLETPLAKEAVSFTKGCYIGQEVIARLDAQGKVQRQLVGLKFEDKLPHVGDRISIDDLESTNPLGDEIGDVTSIAVSPKNGAIGLGYVRSKYANPGAVVSVKDAEGNKLQASVVTLPFEN